MTRIANTTMKEAMKVLKETSRTFFIPITYLPKELKEGVATAYLAMRAIDEIEDDTELDSQDKILLLKSIENLLKEHGNNSDTLERELTQLFQPYNDRLPHVTLALACWIHLTPDSVVDKVIEYTATMAGGMASWVEKEWVINTEADLDDYTYYVAGIVGLLLNELWDWFEDIKADEELAVSFGRGLQAVNMIRNRAEDIERGIDFFPNGWEMNDMMNYAYSNLEKAESYLASIPSGKIHAFCNIPLKLAIGTIEAIEQNKTKLSRTKVAYLVQKAVKESHFSS
ncbi:squalene/phytoene synthase family protein [Alkalihalobacillus trypoxylicola]|uniref:Phytoene synthase n=1 Tax=Alkalihalobacillus trypoxylicola TaxID=519424 RepID=A0A162EER1_9BACI|nr:phytoene/squalene synthase family protein [Alkalihalobacillus trypoxylicola]KYG32401.1 phytoene synthase [Alkalihalobacillus trypoxylicola]